FLPRSPVSTSRQMAGDSGVWTRHGYCADAGIDFQRIPLLLHTTEEFSMAQTKSTRTRARASASTAGTKRTRRMRNAGATNRGSGQQRSGEATTSTRKKGHSGAPTAPEEPTPRRTPSEHDPDSGDVESGGRRPRGGRADETVDE